MIKISDKELWTKLKEAQSKRSNPKPFSLPEKEKN